MFTAPQSTTDIGLPDRRVLSEAYFNLTAHWNLSRNEEARLLGWDYAEKRTTMDSMRKGKTFIDNDDDKIDRIINLINIHKSLRILFPYNRQAVYDWVKEKRQRFGGFSALDIMLQNGKIGILAIRQYLDFERTR